MAQDCTLKIEFPLQITEKDYVQASLIAERRMGSLRSAWPVLILGVAILTIGLFSFSWFSPPFVPILLCGFGPLLILCFFIAEPAAVRKKARQNFATYQRFMEDAQLQLYPDNMQTKTSRLVFTDPYALLAGCVETPDMFVFIRDRARLLILPKRCIPPEKMEETLEFLRLTFVRRRRVMRGWFL